MIYLLKLHSLLNKGNFQNFHNKNNFHKNIEKNCIANRLLTHEAASYKVLNGYLLAVLKEIYDHYESENDIEFVGSGKFVNRKSIISVNATKSKNLFNNLANLYLDIKTYLITNDKDGTLNFLRGITHISEMEQGLKDKGFDTNVGGLENNISITDLKNEELVTMYGNGTNAYHLYRHEVYRDVIMLYVDMTSGDIGRAQKENNRQADFETLEGAIILLFRDANNNYDLTYERAINQDYTGPSINYNTTAWQDYENMKEKPQAKQYTCDISVRMTYSYIDDLNKLMAQCAEAKKKNLVVEYSLLRKKAAGRLFKKVRYAHNKYIQASQASSITNAFIRFFNNSSTFTLACTHYTAKPKPGELPDSSKCCGIILRFDPHFFIAIPETAVTELDNFYTDYTNYKTAYDSINSVAQKAMQIMPNIVTNFNDFLDKLKIGNFIRLNRFIEKYKMPIELTHPAQKDLDMLKTINAWESGDTDRYEITFQLLKTYVKALENAYFDNANSADDALKNIAHTEYTVWDVSDQPHGPEGPKETKETVLELQITFKRGFAYTLERFLMDNQEHILNALDTTNANGTIEKGCISILHDFMQQSAEN